MAETLSAASESDDDSDQSVSIHKAAKHCNVSQLRRALAAGVSPNSTNHVGQPLIISLCYLLPANYIQEARLACLDLLRQEPDFDVNLPRSGSRRHTTCLPCLARRRCRAPRRSERSIPPARDRGGLVRQLRVPTPRYAHQHAHTEAGPRRWAATFATTPLSSPARPARGSPKDRRLRLSRGVLLRIELYMQHVTPHTQIGRLNTALLQLARRRVVGPEEQKTAERDPEDARREAT